MARVQLIHEPLTRSVIGAFFEVYNALGFGFLEQVYVLAMERELVSRRHRVSREVTVRVYYKGVALGTQRLDMIVDDVLIVETKSTYDLHRAPRGSSTTTSGPQNLRLDWSFTSVPNQSSTE